MEEQWNSVGGTVKQGWWNSGTVEQCWWISGTVMVEQYGGTLRWNSGTVLVEQRWWISYGGTVWWNGVTVLVEQWKSDGGTVW